jgi:hypothetical protein
MPGDVDPRYVLARRVMLDALDGLEAHRDALVLVGAQAVYLNCGEAEWLAMAAFTVDADIALFPNRLAREPSLESAMRAAGFEPAVRDGAQNPGSWIARRRLGDEDVLVPVDLLVPAALSPAGRRGARLAGHDKRAAMKSPGIEGAIVDRSPMEIRALEPGDDRVREIDVAGPVALLIAKCHKLRDRLDDADRGRADRLGAKDAVDVLRLMDATTYSDAARVWDEIRKHGQVGEVAETGLRLLGELFGEPDALGVEMAVRGAPDADAERIRALLSGWTRQVIERLGT